MGDTIRWCSSNEVWERQVNGSAGAIYTVTYGLKKKGKERYGYQCDCQGFRYRGSCRHINEVKAQRCGYGWSALAGNPVTMGD